MASQKALSRILQQYCIGEPELYMPLKRGIENENILVQTSQDVYVMRIHRETEGFRTKEYVSFELDVLDALLGTLPVAQVIRKADGDRIFDSGKRHGAVFSFLPGRHIERIQPKHLIALGHAVGKLHNTLRGRTFRHAEKRKQFTHAYAKKQLKANIRNLKDPILRTVFLAASTRLPSATPKLPGGVVHADMHDESVLFKGGRISGIIDWDDATQGPYLIDIAVIINTWCYKGGKLNKQHIKAFLDAYQEERRLTPVEHKHLQEYCLLVTLWHSGYMMGRQHIKKKESLSALRHHAGFLEMIEKEDLID